MDTRNKKLFFLRFFFGERGRLFSDIFVYVFLCIFIWGEGETGPIPRRSKPLFSSVTIRLNDDFFVFPATSGSVRFDRMMIFLFFLFCFRGRGRPIPRSRKPLTFVSDAHLEIRLDDDVTLPEIAAPEVVLFDLRPPCHSV